MITATVIVTIPPNSSDIPIPIAVVIDFGSIVTYCWWLNPNNVHSAKIPNRLANVPDKIPQTTATIFFFNNSNCSYNGTARHTVAGVNRYDMYLALAL